MPRSDLGQGVVAQVTNAHNARRLREHYPEGEGPPEIPRKQSDLSVTSKSSRVDEYYGMDHFKMPSVTPSPELQQSFEVAGSGDSFSTYPAGSNIDADFQYLYEEATKGPIEASVPLYDQLHEAMRDSCTTPTRRWLPFGDLQRLCQPLNVRAELQNHFLPGEADSLTEYVCGKSTHTPKDGDMSRRIFVVLVLIHQIKALPAFKNAEVCDKHLPFERSAQSRTQLISPKSRFPTEPLPCFQKGGMGLVNDFFETQWKTIAPIINRDDNNEVKTFHLAENVIMPWTFLESKKEESGFSTVRKVEIHESHHSFDGHNAFAFKTLLQNDPHYAENEFEQELKAFTKMEPGNHLLDLCATFKIGAKYSFLCPWAEGGSLQQFWKRCPTKVQETPNPQILLRWVAEQCHGLALALQSIHDVRVKALRRAHRIQPDEDTDKDFYGIHGDIKPGNILLFDRDSKLSDIGILKIADFGLTEFHRITSRTRPIYQTADGRTPAPTYDAPELVQFRPWYSRKTDVWALGCVFTEFLVWVAHGSSALGEYAEERLRERDWDHAKGKPSYRRDNFFVTKGYQGSEVETSLKNSVKTRLDNLCQEPNTKEPNFITDFADLLKNKVLVCERENRISCDDLVVELGKLASKARNSRSGDPYWSPSLPSFSKMHRQSTPKLSDTITSADRHSQPSSGRPLQSNSKSTSKVSFAT